MIFFFFATPVSPSFSIENINFKINRRKIMWNEFETVVFLCDIGFIPE